MKALTAFAGCTVALAFLIGAQPAYADPIALDVRVDNVTPHGGPVRVAMYDERGWLGQPIDAEQAEADGRTVIIRLNVPVAGRYGLAAYQDRNGDGRLNRNIIGIPSEPVAFSNGAAIQFGPPRFSDAALDVSSPTTAEIALR